MNDEFATIASNPKPPEDPKQKPSDWNYQAPVDEPTFVINRGEVTPPPANVTPAPPIYSPVVEPSPTPIQSEPSFAPPPVTPGEPPKKSKKIIWIIVAVALLLLCCCCVLVILMFTVDPFDMGLKDMIMGMVLPCLSIV